MLYIWLYFTSTVKRRSKIVILWRNEWYYCANQPNKDLLHRYVQKHAHIFSCHSIMDSRHNGQNSSSFYVKFAKKKEKLLLNFFSRKLFRVLPNRKVNDLQMLVNCMNVFVNVFSVLILNLKVQFKQKVKKMTLSE